MPVYLRVLRMEVRSFRCLPDVRLSLESGTTILVGENNCGKTSLLLALATALGRRRASADDIHRRSDGSAADEVTIDVFLAPPLGQTTFAEETAQRLINVQRDPHTGIEQVGFRTTLKRSAEGSLLSEQRQFLQPVEGTWQPSPAPQFSSRVLELIHAHLLEASRDLFSEMGTQTSAWGRVLSNLKIPDLPDLAPDDPDPQGNRGIERDLRSVAQRVRAASPVLSQLDSDLKGLSQTQAMVRRVELVPLPDRVDELGRTMEVILHHQDSAGLPIRFHGSGSRSLAAIFVFKTMCSINVGADQGTLPHLITLLEEPEAHLHPQTVGALVRVIGDLPGQRVITTHSSALVAESSTSAVRLIRRQGANVRVTQLSGSRPKEIEHFRRFFGRPFGEMFFARLAILGDGATERNALPVLVSMALSLDPAALGISFVDSGSMSNAVSMNKLLSALNDLEIPWIYFADNDEEGIAALGRTTDPATGDVLTLEHPSVCTLEGTAQIEQLMVDAGYGDEITAVALENGETADDDAKRLQFLVSRKPWAAELVAIAAKRAGKTAPPQLNSLISRIREKLGMTPEGLRGA